MTTINGKKTITTTIAVKKKNKRDKEIKRTTTLLQLFYVNVCFHVLTKNRITTFWMFS